MREAREATAAGRRKRMPAGLPVAIAAGAVALQVLALVAMGHPLICTCGRIDLWYGNPAGPETSQHLTDWYTFTHVVHGFGFYFLIGLAAPRLPFAWRLALAVGLESAWEIVENMPFVIERYRQSALAASYFGDSVVNSVSDTAAAVLGFVLARALPAWSSVALVVASELFLGAMIRDNLTLNVIQLIHPSEAISRWQTGR